LAAKIIAPWEALAVAAVLALAAFALILPTNRATILWSVPALIIAVVYPFFKRFFAASASLSRYRVFVWNSDGVSLRLEMMCPRFAWMLLVVNLFWVVAYDTEYAMVDRDDDIHVGIRTSALTFGRFDVAAVRALLCDLSRIDGGESACTSGWASFISWGSRFACVLALRHLAWIRFCASATMCFPRCFSTIIGSASRLFAAIAVELRAAASSLAPCLVMSTSDRFPCARDSRQRAPPTRRRGLPPIVAPDAAC
jgi:4-hydroxybenzoate polyprenyltransferase